MVRRSSTPDEQPPRRRGGRFGWIVGTVPGVIALTFVVLAIVVAMIALAA